MLRRHGRFFFAVGTLSRDESRIRIIVTKSVRSWGCFAWFSSLKVKRQKAKSKQQVDAICGWWMVDGEERAETKKVEKVEFEMTAA